MLITEELQEALATNIERDAVYKDGWRTHALVMLALFPEGIPARTMEEMARFGFLSMIVTKLVRYCTFMPHPDSIHDLGVYAFMLEHLDKEASVNAAPSAT
jgi:hypothetical protein